MNASRLTAIGLVAAAGLWIASGHFLPHDKAESRVAARAGDAEAKKLFRVAEKPSFALFGAKMKQPGIQVGLQLIAGHDHAAYGIVA